MISQDERKSMLRAHSIGPTMIRYLEEIGIGRLADLRGADAAENVAHDDTNTWLLPPITRPCLRSSDQSAC